MQQKKLQTVLKKKTYKSIQFERLCREVLNKSRD